MVCQKTISSWAHFQHLVKCSKWTHLICSIVMSSVFRMLKWTKFKYGNAEYWRTQIVENQFGSRNRYKIHIVTTSHTAKKTQRWSRHTVRKTRNPYCFAYILHLILSHSTPSAPVLYIRYTLVFRKETHTQSPISISHLNVSFQWFLFHSVCKAYTANVANCKPNFWLTL